MIVGVDPGAGGAIAILSPAGDLVDVQDMPVDVVRVGRTDRRRVNPARLADVFRVGLRGIRAHVYVEQVGPNPHDGASGAFAFGNAYGIILGALAALQIPATTIPPAEWKGRMRCPAGKDGARARACQLFPDHSALFARVKDDGRAESAILALYGCKLQRDQ